MSEYIPPKVQAEILKRLPVKPLIQFRSVSKPWKSLIDSRKFTAAYGVHHPQPDRLILRYKDDNIGVERFLTYVDNDDDAFIGQDFAPTVPDLITNSKSRSFAVGSSHGLLCFDCFYTYPCGHEYDGAEIVVVWNPSISKSIRIGVPYMHDCPINHVIGFGVCPVTLDPTILKIEYYGDCSPWKVGVFTLSTGTWSILSTNLSGESIRLTGSQQVVIDRFIYWVAYDTLVAAEDGRSQFLIMSFDLTAKEFIEINLTGSLTDQLYSIHAISKLQESLVLLAYHREFEEDLSVCCLWMMKEQGVSRSFSKLYSINRPHATIKTLLGFRKSGELILETELVPGTTKLKVYKPSSEAIDNLGIDGECYSFFMCSYTETLLLHDQVDGFMYYTRDGPLVIS